MEYTNLVILIIIFITIIKINKKQMATNEELVTGLNDLTTQITKISAETHATLQKVADLEIALANSGNVSPEVDAAFQALKTSVQSVDDLIPDAPVI